jgi:hypothetical protein
LFGTGAGGSANESSIKYVNNQLNVINYVGSSVKCRYVTTAVYRDPSAWYHVVVSSNSSTSLRIYINGVQVTAFDTATAPDASAWGVNTASTASYMGWLSGNSYFDGYLTEVNFIDGQALTPSSFGSTNALTGVWQPARYTGSYGTNGFYLPFTDNSALTTSSNVGLGKDFSGNGNYWTTNNISITAGVTYDSMTDVPTLTSATAANFAVLNPLDCDDLSAGSVYNGNLAWAGVYAGKNGHPIRSTFRTPPSGKWYAEARNVTFSGSGNSLPLGFTYSTQAITSASVFASTIDSFIGVDASVFSNFVQFRTNGVSASLAAYTTLFGSCASGDVINFAIDLSGGKFWIGKNGTWYNSGDPAAGTNATSTFTVGSGNWTFLAEYVSAGDNGNRSSAVLNFGQQPFTLTPPSGFVALNTYNLPTSTILKGNTVMDATLWTGTNANLSVTNAASFKPDLVWIKDRSVGYNHVLQDSVRGTGGTKKLSSNLTDAEGSANLEPYGSVSAFNSNGFSLTTGSIDSRQVNASGDSYVGWQWQAGQGSSSSNTNGSITSTVSVNASAGFSVVTYTAQASGTGTVGHGLGVAPSLYITKPRANAFGWASYHASLGNTQYVELDRSIAAATASTVWNNTSPTSSVFTLGTAFAGNGTYVTYCWTPIAGYSAFGSYTGNGSTDGTFVYTGFRPKFVMVKDASNANNWQILDTARDTYNVAANIIQPNLSNAESAFGLGGIDFLSNGFKVRTSSTGINTSGATVIYAAFAESPFRNSLAR